MGGKGWQRAKGPEVWGARDRLLVIGNTGTFHSNCGPNAETKETSLILGAVFKLQRMRNSIKQILQKRQAALPDASTSCASTSGISHPHSAALLPWFIRDKQSCVIYSFIYSNWRPYDPSPQTLFDILRLQLTLPPPHWTWFWGAPIANSVHRAQNS